MDFKVLCDIARSEGNYSKKVYDYLIDFSREQLIDFCKNADKNGSYTDKDSALDGYPPMTEKELHLLILKWVSNEIDFYLTPDQIIYKIMQCRSVKELELLAIWLRELKENGESIELAIYHELLKAKEREILF